MDNRHISEELTEMAHDLIQNMEELEYIRDSNVQIIFLESEHKKVSNRRKVFGQCEKVADKYKWGIPCDFTITLFSPNLEGMTDEQVKIVLFHELLHVGIEMCGDGSEYYYIVPHDLEDFKLIIDKYGTNWAEIV